MRCLRKWEVFYREGLLASHLIVFSRLLRQAGILWTYPTPGQQGLTVKLTLFANDFLIFISYPR